MSAPKGQTLAVLRSAVGVTLILWPERFLRLSGREAPTAASILLLRTVGVRDLALGFGGLSAARRGSQAELRRWTATGAASDCLDVVASLASIRAIGRKEGAAAALTAGAFAVADFVALRQRVTPLSAQEHRCQSDDEGSRWVATRISSRRLWPR